MKFLSQTGATLLQGLVISSVLAGSALVATRLVQDQKKMMKGVETRDQIEQLHRLVFGVLQNRENCQGTFLHSTGANITTATLGQTNNISMIRAKASSAGVGTWQTTYEVNPGTVLDLTKTYMNGSVTIQSMQLRFPSASDPARENVMTYPAKLRIEYARLEGTNMNKRTKTGFGGKRLIKEIGILMQIGTPAAGVYPLNACYAVQLGSSNNGQTLEGNNNLNQEFCSNLGSGGSLYVWDSLQNKCVLKNNVCPAKYVFVGIKADGNAECKPMSYFLPYMVNTIGTTACNTTSGATVSLTTDVSGKVQMSCIPGGGGASCTPPWGGSVAHGVCVNAYNSASANNCSAGTFPTCRSCTDHHSQSRCCNNGTLSGTYTLQTCGDYCSSGMSCI